MANPNTDYGCHGYVASVIGASVSLSVRQPKQQTSASAVWLLNNNKKEKVIPMKLKVTGKEWFWSKMLYIMPKRAMAELSKPNGVFDRLVNGTGEWK